MKIRKVLQRLINIIESKDPVTPEENVVYETIKGVLCLRDTEIHDNIESNNKIYLVKNDELKIAIVVNTSTYVIRRTNSHYSLDVKYRSKFVEDIVLLIVEEKQNRLQELIHKTDDKINLIAKAMLEKVNRAVIYQGKKDTE